MALNQAALDKATQLIKAFEGFRAHAYLDGGGVPTIGWGFTGPNVHLGQIISEADAEQQLQDKIQFFARAVSNMLVHNVTTTNQFAALIDFGYNLGIAALSGSTLLRFHNTNKQLLAAEQFLRWNHDNGIVVAGLTRRREAEKAIYLVPSDNMDT